MQIEKPIPIYHHPGLQRSCPPTRIAGADRRFFAQSNLFRGDHRGREQQHGQYLAAVPGYAAAHQEFNRTARRQTR